MLTLFKKEINGFLNSLIGYIVIIVFLLMTGLFLWVFPMQFNILDFTFANLDGLFILGPFVFLFLILTYLLEEELFDHLEIDEFLVKILKDSSNEGGDESIEATYH